MKQLTTDGLKLFVDGDGLHWLRLGENVALCLEHLIEGGNTSEQLGLWRLAAQKPIQS